jgi:indolepyruvate decarboxylase
VTSWRYSEIPHALDCDDWFTVRVTICGELDDALRRANRDGGAAYIEVVTDTFAASPMSLKLQESVKTLYTP